MSQYAKPSTSAKFDSTITRVSFFSPNGTQLTLQDVIDENLRGVNFGLISEGAYCFPVNKIKKDATRIEKETEMEERLERKKLAMQTAKGIRAEEQEARTDKAGNLPIPPRREFLFLSTPRKELLKAKPPPYSTSSYQPSENSTPSSAGDSDELDDDEVRRDLSNLKRRIEDSSQPKGEKVASRSVSICEELDGTSLQGPGQNREARI